MVYDPIKKREYDRIRNAQLKAEYLAKNPNYNPKKKSKYEDTPPITQSSSFNSFIDLYTPPPPLPQNQNIILTDWRRKKEKMPTAMKRWL